MYTKIKNTLSALTIAASFLLAGYGLGEPVSPLTGDLNGALIITTDGPVVIDADAAQSSLTTPHAPSKRGIKRHLGMPFMSFSPLPSRRGA